MQKFPWIAAHTGCDGTPDNTIESFMEGIRLGADIVEIDIRIARDGTLVLLHDDHPSLHECTYEQLNDAKVRRGISPAYEARDIVRLGDLLPLARERQIQLNLDIKTPAAIEAVIRTVRQQGMTDQVFITGCSEGITERHPDIRVVLNTPTRLTAEHYMLFAKRVCKAGTEGRCYGLNMKYETCRRELVELAHERGLAVWVYTLKEREDMLRLIHAGVDAITAKEVARLGGLKRELGQ
ncbi:glycerophosphodiester phosphodiesterase [Paenibacillus doosanensis]|uniref:Cytoplasmic glycerophosphodiester phosphodiesterase n=1 Tax=Paenibacillus konkukensis TaxID=2020716 RepID=A0ABY4RR76_9BACL|nr:MULTISPECIES: glycerophosphodiester phosphodiesterase [Paenibacillus]MCS7459635.1 glycerophosphodiester phosphodiesterase [Paenibacillus doosanensis]UQZ84705.1 cytoplasmic glycerophosphodiester phosphodiesterase [Paenibacillus konkukensis]